MATLLEQTVFFTLSLTWYGITVGITIAPKNSETLQHAVHERCWAAVTEKTIDQKTNTSCNFVEFAMND